MKRLSSICEVLHDGKLLFAIGASCLSMKALAAAGYWAREQRTPAYEGNDQRNVDSQTPKFWLHRICRNFEYCLLLVGEAKLDIGINENMKVVLREPSCQIFDVVVSLRSSALSLSSFSRNESFSKNECCYFVLGLQQPPTRSFIDHPLAHSLGQEPALTADARLEVHIHEVFLLFPFVSSCRVPA